MNDTELDEMLDLWKTPPMRESLRDDVRAGFVRSLHRPPRFELARTILGRMAVATAVVAALLFAVVQISPRTVRMASSGYHIPFYVESIFERFDRDGKVEYRALQTWFPYAGYPINMVIVQTGNPLLDPIRRIAASIRTQVVLAMPSLVLPKQPPMQEPEWYAGFVKSGCSEGRPVIGHETIAGHDTTIIQSPTPQGRIRAWLAPDLGCYALKVTWEVAQPNGSYRFQTRTEAIEVTMNP